MEKNEETLLEASKERGLKVNTKKNKYMLSCHQNIRMANKSFQNLTKLSASKCQKENSHGLISRYYPSIA
jgi:hypothetical protein